MRPLVYKALAILYEAQYVIRVEPCALAVVIQQPDEFERPPKF